MTPLPDTWNDDGLAQMSAGAAYRRAGPASEVQRQVPSYPVFIAHLRLARSIASAISGALPRRRPSPELHPFAGLEGLVVHAEMLDLMPHDFRQIGVRLHVDVALGHADDGTAMIFSSPPPSSSILST